MTPNVRKLLLTSHITVSVGLMGTVASFLLLAVIGMLSSASETHRVTYPAMNMITLFGIVPLALASLAIGAIQSLVSPWGLFRHNWVVAELLLSILTVAVLLMQLKTIQSLALTASQGILSDADLGPQMRVLIHATGGLAVLVAATVLSIYKPIGMTRFGKKKLMAANAMKQRV